MHSPSTSFVSTNLATLNIIMAVFTDLPHELRQLIFQEYLAVGIREKCETPRIFQLDLCRVSRQVHKEAIEVHSNEAVPLFWMSCAEYLPGRNLSHRYISE